MALELSYENAIVSSAERRVLNHMEQVWRGTVPLQPFMPWLFGAMAISIAGVLGGIWRGSGLGLALALATFILTVAAVALRVNGAYWAATPAPTTRIEATQRNARLMAIAYVWGALAMAASYGLTDLRWRHGWQYALAMGLIAVLFFYYAVQIWRSREAPRRLAALQALSIPLAIAQLALGIGGLVFMLTAGKLASQRSDWVANQIFTAGALTVTVLGLVALTIDRRLSRTEDGVAA